MLTGRRDPGDPVHRGGRNPDHPDAAGYWFAIAYLVVLGSVVLFSLYVYTLQRWTASAVSYSTLLFPFVGVTAATIAFGERIRWRSSSAAPWPWPASTSARSGRVQGVRRQRVPRSACRSTIASRTAWRRRQPATDLAPGKAWIGDDPGRRSPAPGQPSVTIAALPRSGPRPSSTAAPSTPRPARRSPPRTRPTARSSPTSQAGGAGGHRSRRSRRRAARSRTVAGRGWRRPIARRCCSRFADLIEANAGGARDARLARGRQADHRHPRGRPARDGQDLPLVRGGRSTRSSTPSRRPGRMRSG